MLVDYLPATMLEVEDELQKPLYEKEVLGKQSAVYELGSIEEVKILLEQRPIDWHGIIAVAHIALTKEREEG